MNGFLLSITMVRDGTLGLAERLMDFFRLTWDEEFIGMLSLAASMGILLAFLSLILEFFTVIGRKHAQNEGSWGIVIWYGLVVLVLLKAMQVLHIPLFVPLNLGTFIDFN